MKPFAIAALAAAALVAGCSGKDESDAGKGGPASVEEAAKQAEAAGLKPQPGLYKTTITMTGLDIPGLPEDMKGHGAGIVRTLESCLTQAEVDKGFETLLTKGQDGTCTFENFALKDGAFQAMLVCEAQAATTRTAMEGTATATGADFTAATKMSFGGTEGTLNVSGQHRRTGDCPAQGPAPKAAPAPAK